MPRARTQSAVMPSFDENAAPTEPQIAITHVDAPGAQGVIPTPQEAGVGIGLEASREDETPAVRRAPQHTAQSNPRETPHVPDHDPARVRTRTRKSTVQDDMFFIPVDEIPEGSSYEWKRYTNVGEENPFYIAEMRRQGWEPVDPKRHPTWVPPGYKLPYIIKGGQILMERPMSLTLEARAETREMAKTQIREAEQRLGMTPKDTMTRNFDGVEPRIKKELMRPVPIEE